MRAAFATLLACLLRLTAPPATASTTTCTNTLTCTAEDINGMTIAQRLAFVRALSAGPAGEIVPGHAPRWRNIEGVLRFFVDRGLGAPGTWVSYVDAGILEGIERGIALARGDSTDTFGNPGAPLWASCLTRLRDGSLTARSAHDRAWSEAEQASTEHGACPRRGSHLADNLAEFDVPGGAVNFLALFHAYANALAEDYLPT